MRLIKFLLGLSLGAAAGVLLAPKSGRELREQLLGRAAGRLLPPVAEHYPLSENEPIEEAPVGRSATPAPAESAVATPPVQVEASVHVEEATPAAASAYETETRAGAAQAASVDATAVAEAETIILGEQELAAASPVAEQTVAADAGTSAEAPVAEVVLTETPAEVQPEPGADELAPEEAAAAQPIVVPEAVFEPVVADESAVVEVADAGAARPPDSVIAPPEAAGDDLLPHIEATRAAVAADLSEPFSRLAVSTETPREGHPGFLPETSIEPEPAAEADTLEAWQAGEGRAEEGPAPAAEMPPAVTVEPEESAIGWIREGEGLVAAIATDVHPGEPSVAAETPLPLTEAASPVGPTEIHEPEPVGEALHSAEHVVSPPQAVEEPAPLTEPLTTTPSAGETASRESGVVDQAEMRRRIEETRARLKAKAFDAMMSGESALLRNDSGLRPVPSEPDTRLEPEIDSKIDRSLSQEDV